MKRSNARSTARLPDRPLSRWFAIAWATLLLAACTTTPAPTAPTLEIEVLQAGIFESIRTGKIDAPGTPIGTIHEVDPIRDPRLVTATDRIPARVGVSFGIQYVVAGRPDINRVVRFRVRVLHPPLTPPGGSEQTRSQQWEGAANVGIARYVGFAFDEPWEAVPGEWTLELVDDQGRILARQRFIVEPG